MPDRRRKKKPLSSGFRLALTIQNRLDQLADLQRHFLELCPQNPDLLERGDALLDFLDRARALQQETIRLCETHALQYRRRYKTTTRPDGEDGKAPDL